MPNATISPQVESWFKSNPQSMADFLKVIKKFLENVGGAPGLGPPGSADPPIVEGAPVFLTTVPISQETIDKLYEAEAEAEVLGDAWLVIKTFLTTAIMFGL